jgi:hypothetical protein
MAEHDLANVYVTSGVNEAGEPFLTVAAHSRTGGVILVGRLDPAEVRATALAWLSSAEAAEQDAAVLRTVRHLELPDGFASAIIGELRASRPGDA